MTKTWLAGSLGTADKDIAGDGVTASRKLVSSKYAIDGVDCCPAAFISDRANRGIQNAGDDSAQHRHESGIMQGWSVP
eukprot:12895271-Prorocentrum_lima.AAC.1